MNISIQLKSFLAKTFEFSGLINYNINKHSRNEFLILMYHRIIPYKEAEQGLQAGMYVEPDTFEMHIKYLKSRFKVISLKDIYENLKGVTVMNNNFPVCVITFDDGWYDFFKYAYPILDLYKVPATVFLPTQYIGTENRFWTDQVWNLLEQKKNLNKKKHYPHFSNNLIMKKLSDLDGPIEKITAGAISILKNYKDEEIIKILEELKKTWNIDSDYNKRVFLNWEEVKIMARSGIIYFGSHTVRHKVLTRLNKKEIMEELIDSKNYLLKKECVNPLFIPFCYPNGNYDENIMRMVKEAGYHIAVTTENGWNKYSTKLFDLRRVAMHQDISASEEMLGCRIINFF